VNTIRHPRARPDQLAGQGEQASAITWIEPIQQRVAVALELFRALQGVGGAVLFATATPLLRAEFSGAALPRALGAFGATLGGAGAIGPLVGGVLTDTLGWRFIFFVNLPIGVAAFAGGAARLANPATWPAAGPTGRVPP
jgi:MFS family permease